LIGADKNSEWSNGKLVIDANHGPSLSYKLRLMHSNSEVQRHGIVVWDNSSATEVLSSFPGRLNLFPIVGDKR